MKAEYQAELKQINTAAYDISVERPGAKNCS